ncbi:hypothetical protein VPH35_040539 [Triticum aestivum]
MVCGCGRWHHNADGQRSLMQMLPAARGAELSKEKSAMDSPASGRSAPAYGDAGTTRSRREEGVGCCLGWRRIDGSSASLQASGTPGVAAVHDEQLATPYGRGCRHQGEERSVGGEKDRDRGVGRRSGRLSFMPNELLR